MKTGYARMINQPLKGNTIMATIKTELNTQNFIAAFGDHELVHEFSEEAIEGILEQYERVQGESDDPLSIDWQSLFNDALEWNDRGVIYELGGHLVDHADAILDMVRTVGIGEGTNIQEILDVQTGHLSEIDLLELLRNDLMKFPSFVTGVADILARENDFIKMNNGKYLILGAY